MTIWTDEMKAAAMADAQKVCDLTEELRIARAENERLRDRCRRQANTLKPFADFAEAFPGTLPDVTPMAMLERAEPAQPRSIVLTASAFRQARTVYLRNHSE